MKLHVGSSIRTLVVLAIAFSFSGPLYATMAAPAPQQRLVIPAVGVTIPSLTQPSQVKSYREWKANRLVEAETRVKSLKETLLKSRGLSLSATEAGLSGSLQRMLDKEELQLSLAQDLTISDYFVGYLTKQKSLNQAIKDVSGRLSAEEVAELMTAYADNFFASKPPTSVQPAKADSGL